MKLTMLGTGNAMVTDCYNTCFVLTNENNDHFLVDGGGGIGLLRQLKAANINWRDIRTIFVTHKHLDHILGIVWMIRMICQHMAQGEYDGEATIYTHDDVAEQLLNMAEGLLPAKHTKLIGNRLHLVIVKDGEQANIIGQNVTFFDIKSTKAKQFGFMMELEDGSRLTCCGDEPYRDHCEQYARGSRWLLHEAFCLAAQADIFHPYEKHHSTAKDAAETAQRLDVDNLLLYHTEEKNLPNRKSLYTAEGQEYFKGSILVPDDLEVFEL